MILTLDKLLTRRQFGRAQRQTWVLTNGCFDLLHVGHVRYLQEASELGSVLVVAINSDRSVRELKGEGRPVVTAAERAEVLNSLACVDYVAVFDSLRVTPVIHALRPDVWAKGGDYTLETMDPGERAALEECGAEIRFLPLTVGRSTTRLLQRAAEREAG